MKKNQATVNTIVTHTKTTTEMTIKKWSNRNQGHRNKKAVSNKTQTVA
jgi:hypothetical protein